MAREDSKLPFLDIPWTAELLNEPRVVWQVPSVRRVKKDTEDALMSALLKSPTTLTNYICFYKEPVTENEPVAEVSTLMFLGDGMNGHHGIIHGGIIATLCDEAMGRYLSVAAQRAHGAKVRLGQAEGSPLDKDVVAFTVELKMTYMKPVRTPGVLLITTKCVRQDRRKTWLRCEVKQRQGYRESGEEDIVVCSIGESLFVEPKVSPVLRL